MLEQASVSNSKYFQALCEAMTLCAEHPKAIFFRAGCSFRGNSHVPHAQAPSLGEEAGAACRREYAAWNVYRLGAAGTPADQHIPRINFLLEAISQLVQHLDKIPLYSDYRPKVLIRTAIATPYPLDPGSPASRRLHRSLDCNAKDGQGTALWRRRGGGRVL